MQQLQKFFRDSDRLRKPGKIRAMREPVRRASAATIEHLECRRLLNSIGLNFTGGYNTGAVIVPPTTLGPTETAGAFDAAYNPGGVTQAFWNNLSGGTGTKTGLQDSTGATLATSVNWSSAGTWAASTTPPTDGNEKLNTGFINSGGSQTPINVTVNNIPYAQYDVYVFTMDDAVRVETTTAYGVTYYSTSPDPRGSVPGNGSTPEFFLDGNPATPYAYIPSTSRNINAPSNNGDMVVFHLQGGPTFNFSSVSPGNGFVNGVQIVDTSADHTTHPETPALTAASFSSSTTLIWHSPEAGAATQGIAGGYSFVILRGTSSFAETPYTMLSAAPGTTSFAINPDGFPGTTYFYWIEAVSPNGVIGNPSNEVERLAGPAGASPGPVNNFAAATDTTVPSISLSWTPPTSTADAYTIFRSSTGPSGFYSTLVTLPGSATSYVDQGPSLGTGGSYLYKIQAQLNGNKGPTSNFVGGGFNINAIGDGLTGYYFNNANEGTWRVTSTFQPPYPVAYTPVFSRIDPTINITGAGTANAPPGAPISWNSNGGVGSSFAVEWIGQIQPPTNGFYTFYPIADDGIELLIQDINTGRFQVLDDNYNLSRASLDTRVTPFSFIAGQKYGIEVVFRQEGGGWDAELRWQGPGVTKDIVPTSALYAAAPVPVALTAQANDRIVKLLWPSVAADRLIVERGTSAGSLTQIATLAGGAQSYVDTAVTDGKTYFYKIAMRAVGSDGLALASTDTSTVSATPNNNGLPAPVLNVPQVNL